MLTPVETFLQAYRARERSQINDMENKEDQKNFEKTQDVKKIKKYCKDLLRTLSLKGRGKFYFGKLANLKSS